jgi:hypothetical protein
VKAGDAFYIRDRSVDTHLWVVISDPRRDPGRVIMVSVTTFEDYKEDVCPINAGDHPRVTHRSCVAYHEARMTTLERLIALRDGNHLSIQDPIFGELLARIREGVNRSRTIKYKYVEILLEQEVIE